MSVRIFALAGASGDEVQGVKQALDDAGIEYYETPKSLMSDYALWVKTKAEAEVARKAIDAFQVEWQREVRASHGYNPIKQVSWPAIYLKWLAVAVTLYFLYQASILFMAR